MSNRNDFNIMFKQCFDNFTRRLTFPVPVLTAQTEITGLLLLIIVLFDPSSVKFAPAAFTTALKLITST